MAGKKYLKDNILIASKKRISYLFDNFKPEEIWLSFSGGKDSTVCFYLYLEEAKKRDAKINILIIDLEGHYKLHIDFMEKLLKDNDKYINKCYWLCLPFQLSNASSFHQPKWLCWDEKEKSKWIRQLPKSKYVINDINYFGDYFRKGMEFEEFIISFPKYLIKKQNLKKVAQIIGIRTQESYNRYLKMRVKQNREFFNNKQWILKQKSTSYDTYSVHPIYDWLTEDVWKYSLNKPYNKTYDTMYKAGIPLSEMRICQPYGEEQRNNLDLFAKIEPKTWAKIQERCLGVNFAKIYKGKGVYKGVIKLPPNTTWEEWGRLILSTMPPFLRQHYLRRINVFLRWWRKETLNDIPSAYAKEYAENETFDELGIYNYKIYDEHQKDTIKEVPSWRRITKVLVKGDYYCKNLTFTANKKEYEKLEELKEKWESEL